ncbi:MAG TPA: ABC transporter substrate-binding protein [Gaiellaceae bacterium]|nr:ABC transporter substrate-binding protein [Gaiellaceae bacterium]
MHGKRWFALAALVALLALGGAACGGSDDNSDASGDTTAADTGEADTGAAATTDAGGPATGEPIVIGWAFDSSGNMAPFDNPALAAAKIRVEQLNEKGGVGGRPFEIKTCDTQNNDPAKAKACASQLLGDGADVMFVTCDVDFATPVVQESINDGKLTIAPCIGTDQMGPKRFGEKGKLAFSFGNVAQDEGSAMAEFAWAQGWKTAALATNTLLVYFKNIVQAFDARFTELGGEIVGRETYATGANNVGAAVSRLNGEKADVIVTSTAFGELPGLVSGIRALGNETPILNSWAGDGTYWVTKNPQVTNYYAVTYASIFGDDPNPEVKDLIAKLTAGNAAPGTGGFITGAAAIDGVATAIDRAGGSTDGAALATEMEGFTSVETISGNVNFSTELHSVFGREYRVIKVDNNEGSYVGPITAKVVPDISG